MQPGSKNPPFLPAPCPGDVCTHTGARVRHILQPPGTALPSTESHCPGAMWQGPASGPHERGPGTSPAGTQLLLAPNKGHLTARTARCLWVQQQGQGTRHRAATRTSPAARQGQHRDSTGTQLGPQDQLWGRVSQGSDTFPPRPYRHGCPGSSPVLVVDVVPKARGVDDGQLHANPLLLDLCNEKEAAV